MTPCESHSLRDTTFPPRRLFAARGHVDESRKGDIPLLPRTVGFRVGLAILRGESGRRVQDRGDSEDAKESVGGGVCFAHRSSMKPRRSRSTRSERNVQGGACPTERL